MASRPVACPVSEVVPSMACESNATNDELVVQAVAGDRLALAQLLYLHHHALSSHLARQIAGAAGRPVRVEVEDVLQETYLCAFRDIRHCAARHERAFA